MNNFKVPYTISLRNLISINKILHPKSNQTHIGIRPRSVNQHNQRTQLNKYRNHNHGYSSHQTCPNKFQISTWIEKPTARKQQEDLPKMYKNWIPAYSACGRLNNSKFSYSLCKWFPWISVMS